MPGGGTLSVGLRGKGEQAVIEFLNTGAAVHKDHLESLTEPFFSTKQGKRGLGLSWARKIVEEHGGKLEVGNAREGGVSAVIQLG